MKHTILILAMLFGASYAVYGQLGLQLSAGPSIPVGDYGDNDIDNEDAQAASLGFHLGAGATYTLAEYLGVSLNVGYIRNPFDEDGLEDQLNDGLGANVNVRADPFQWLYVNLGPKIGYSGESFGLALTPVIGMSHFSEQLVSLRTTFTVTESEAASVIGLIYGLGLDAEYRLSEGVSLGFRASYLAGNAEKDIDSVFILDGILEEDFSDTDDYRPQVINLGLTLGITL